MDFTTDKLRSLVRKWQTLIEAQVDVKTTDGYLLRMFAIAFTKKRAGQVRGAPSRGVHPSTHPSCMQRDSCSNSCAWLAALDGRCHARGAVLLSLC